jgi:membrane fusion protein, copper/silver efflux system
MKIPEFLARGKNTLVIVLVVAAGIAGFLYGQTGGNGTPVNPAVQLSVDSTDTVWTCSMHPQIRQSGPGQCPICGMDLIPVESTDDHADHGPRHLSLSPTAARLADIMVAPVERRFVEHEISLNGRIETDETRVKSITSWVPGRIDRLYVDYTGISVREGDHLAELYSPSLISAQEEYLQAIIANRDLSTGNLSTTRDTARLTIDAAREKLRLLGMPPLQISALEERGEASEHITIYSPAAGVVIHRNVTEGMYVDTGTPIYTVANLSQVWVLLDVYESDLQWIRYGQEVTFRTESGPGEAFTGRISFIAPLVDPATRTITVRVNVPNTDGRLKPDMLVKAVVHARIAAGGTVMDPSLAGKYLCPMHPEIVKSHAGSCDVCEMDLVTAASMGYAAVGDVEAPLIIPRSSPLITGRRAVVYVKDPVEDGLFEGREIVLGPRAGEYYQVADGLREGEMVVVNGAFKIDSALQIQARPSMMSPEGGVAPPVHNHGGGIVMAQHATQPEGHDHGAHQMDTPSHEMGGDTDTATDMTYDAPETFLTQLNGVFQGYFAIQKGLSHDSLEDAVAGASRLRLALLDVDMALLEHEPHMAWMKQLAVLNSQSAAISGTSDIKEARTAFRPLSTTAIAVARMFGHRMEQPVTLFHCPMAFNNDGAYWLQNIGSLENPFFGSTMFKCGTNEGDIPGTPESASMGRETE